MKKIITIGYDARMFGDQFTGIGRYNYEITKRLFERKNISSDVGTNQCVFQVEWVIFLNEPEYSVYDFPAHVTKVCVNAKHYSLAEQTKFVRALYKAKCDLVHFSHFNLPVLYRKPFTVTIHDTTLSFFPGQKTKRWQKLAYQLVMRNALRSSQKIITVSHNTAQDVQTLFGIKPQKIQPIWNGLTDDFVPTSAEEKTAIRKKYNLGKRYLFYCGVWREHKNIKGLLEAFVQLSLRFPDLELVLTGAPDRTLLEVVFAASGLPSESTRGREIRTKIKMLGKVPFEDLLPLMGSAEAFIFPSFYEGFGLPLLEAMKAGVPVVSSNTSSLPEVGGAAALYFDPYSVDDIVEKTSRVLTQSSLDKQKMIQAGFDQAKKFSWDSCADAMWKEFVANIIF